jgi:hypothetical protein
VNIVYLDVKGLTPMSTAVPLAHRDFCYQEPSSKYSGNIILSIAHNPMTMTSILPSSESPCPLSVDIPTTGSCVVCQGQHTGPVSRCPCAYWCSYCGFEFAVLVIGYFQKLENVSCLIHVENNWRAVKFARIYIEVCKYSTSSR